MVSGDPPGALGRVIGLPQPPLSSLLYDIRQVSPPHQTEGVVGCQPQPVTSVRLSGLVWQASQGEGLTGVQLTERAGRLPPADPPDPSSPQRDRAPGGGPGGGQGEAGPGQQGDLQWLPSPRVQQPLLRTSGLLQPEEARLAGREAPSTVRERNQFPLSQQFTDYNLGLRLEVSFSVARTPARALQRLECQE